MAKVVIVTNEQSIRIPNSYNLMSFHEEGILILTSQQIRRHEKYEVCAKEWMTVVVNNQKNLLSADPQPRDPQA
ncbi:hypothetical protein Hanom_Chr12g01129591 [Helianthus anomalus]